MLNLTKYIKFVLIVGAILLILPVFLVFYNFTNHNLSKEILDWGSFGDFLSGTIGIVISLINLAILILLSLYVAKLDMHRHFNEFRYISFVKLCEKFDNINDTSKSYSALLEYVKSFVSRNSFAYSSIDYKELESITNELIESIKEIIKILKLQEQCVSNGSTEKIFDGDSYFLTLYAESISNIETKINPDFLAFETMKLKRDKLLSYIQDIMKKNK